MKTKAEKEEKQRMWSHGKHWVRGQMIGKGGYGSVFVAFSKKPKWGRRLPEVIAVKSAKLSKSDSIRHEAEVLFEIQGCPFVIQRLGEETTTSHNGEMIYNLLLEYAPAGTLDGLIQRSNGHGLPESDVINYTRSILEGIKHIHMCGYVHCDLKPENILLVPNTATRDEFLPKIADFGLAKKFDHKCRRWRGTPEYQSPEAYLHNMQYQPSDIWSLGCIVLEMLVGKSAWQLKSGSDFNDDIYLDHLRTCKIPAHISDEAKDFLQYCLAMKSWERLTAQELLNHPFVAQPRLSGLLKVKVVNSSLG